MADTDTPPADDKQPAKGDEGTTAASGGNAATGAAGDQSGTKVITLTQDQLDAMIERRLAKAKDPEVERKAKAYDDLQAEQQTEQERLAARAKEVEEASQRRIAEADLRLKAADIRLQAAAQGVRPDAIDLVVDRLLGSDDIEVSDKGEVRGAEAAVKALVGKMDFLKATDPKLPARSGGEHTGSPAQTVEQKIKELEDKGDFKAARALKLRAYENRTGTTD